jgi:aryl carrier-like protein
MSNPRKYAPIGGSASDDHAESTLNNNRQSYEESKETFRILREMSEILNCGLRSETLGHCIRLVEEGADPVRLAELIKKWRARAAAATPASDPTSMTKLHPKKHLNANGSG